MDGSTEEPNLSLKPTKPRGSPRPRLVLTQVQREQLGRLLKNKRNAAGLSRAQLSRQAKLSEATVKFLETALHMPSRSTLSRLVQVPELRLSWSDVPGHPAVAEPAVAEPPVATALPALSEWRPAALNCFIAPSYDALALVDDLARFLQGAGGHLEQTNAYLDHYSSAAYLAICQNSLAVAALRSSIPLAQAAAQIRAACGPVALQVIALGAGDGVLEARLVGHLLDESADRVELCLVDISQPLLNRAYRHAADALTDAGNAYVWGVQCDFHQLPLYPELYPAFPDRPQRRLFCMLGGTLANLDQEPRFFRQSLLPRAPGDLLLLDLQSVSAPCDDPRAIRRQDKLFSGGVPTQYAAWLGGVLWRHCKQVVRVDFSWDLETHCPVPGSYALAAVATVETRNRADRRFSLFRFSRYDPARLSHCLSQLGWEEISALLYAGEHSLRLYRGRGVNTEGTV